MGARRPHFVVRVAVIVRLVKCALIAWAVFALVYAICAPWYPVIVEKVSSHAVHP